MDIKMNKSTLEIISQTLNIEEVELLSSWENETYIRLSKTGFKSACELLAERQFSLIGLFCAENFEQKNGLTLFYAFKQAGKANVLVIVFDIQKEDRKSVV